MTCRCCCCSSDIMGVNLYVTSYGSAPWIVSNSNYTIYISTTSVFRNGTLCVNNLIPTVFDTNYHFVPCPAVASISYVTVLRPITSSSGSIHFYELQVVRSGENQKLSYRHS